MGILSLKILFNLPLVEALYNILLSNKELENRLRALKRSFFQSMLYSRLNPFVQIKSHWFKP